MPTSNFGDERIQCQRHYEANHEDYVAYVGEQRKQKVVKLQTALSAQQAIFKKLVRSTKQVLRPAILSLMKLQKM